MVEDKNFIVQHFCFEAHLGNDVRKSLTRLKFYNIILLLKEIKYD